MSLVYLCGPITGLDYNAATDWRNKFKNNLVEGIKTLSPMRGKDYLLKEKYLAALGYNETVMSTARGITTRDRFDTIRADMIVANFLGAKKASIGSMIELGWADANRVPVIVIMEKEGNVHDHAMVNEIAGFRVETVEEAAHIVNIALGV